MSVDTSRITKPQRRIIHILHVTGFIKSPKGGEIRTLRSLKRRNIVEQNDDTYMLTYFGDKIATKLEETKRYGYKDS